MLEAARQRHQAEEFARSSGNCLRSGHHWRKTARRWTTAEAVATQRYDRIAEPVRQKLEHDLRTAEQDVTYLQARAALRRRWLEQHPDHDRRLDGIERELDPTPTIQQRLQALQIEPPSHSRGLGLEL